MEAVTHKIVYFFFVHVFLRRIAKRYPEFFEKWVHDDIESPIGRKIIKMRYMGDSKTKFCAIAIELGLDERNLYRYHKEAVERMIFG